MAQGRLAKRFKDTVKFNNVGCIPLAIKKDGRTLEQILRDIRKEKLLELEVLMLHYQNLTENNISTMTKIPISKVRHIITFDRLGLSYRKIGKNSKNTNK